MLGTTRHWLTTICRARPATLLQKLGIKLAHAILKQARMRISWTCCKHSLLSSLFRKMPEVWLWCGSWTIQTVSWWLVVTEKMSETRYLVSGIRSLCGLRPWAKIPKSIWRTARSRLCLQNMFCQLSSSQAGRQSGKYFKIFATCLLINFTIMRRNMCSKLSPS